VGEPIREAAVPAGERAFGERVVALAESNPPVYVLAPLPALSVAATRAVFDSPPVASPVDAPVRMVTTPAVLDRLYDTFRAGHQAAELADRGVVDYRAVESLPVSGPLVVAGDTVEAVVSFGRSYGHFDPSRANLASLGCERAATLYERSDPVVADRPAWRTVTTGLAERATPETLSALTDLLDARRAAPADRTVDVATVAVVAGARAEARQKAVAAWCAEQSVAAASTVSGRKSTLVERDVVEASPDRDGVGAPVHRLTLADDYLAAASTEDLYDVVASVLGE
jgi:hypothetical protein